MPIQLHFDASEVPMQPRLLAITGSLTGTVQQLVDGHISIGRDDANQMCLADPVVSRKHCTIRKMDQQHELVDLDSQNGTFVNGTPIRRKTVEHGDTIRIGSAEFVFLTHEGELPITSKIRLSDSSSKTRLSMFRVEDSPVAPAFGIEVGRMARDLTALFRISNIINSIRDSLLLQRELLRLIFEVVPADEGAVVLLTDFEEETLEICRWS